MNIAEIRRYPVKSMGGESLPYVDLDARGLVGDRRFSVVDQDGKLGSGKNSSSFRRFDEIFDYSASMVDDEVRVVGPAGSWRVGDLELDRTLRDHLGAEVHVQRETGTPFYDAGPGLARGHGVTRLVPQASRRRRRPSPDPSQPRRGHHRALRRGDLGRCHDPGRQRRTQKVDRRIERCRMVDIAQEGLVEQRGWLKALGRERDLCLGIYADVRTPGRIDLGDALSVG